MRLWGVPDDENWRSDNRWTKARQRAVDRDDGRCQICGSRRGIEVHHLNSAQHFPSLRFLLRNLICLCGRCHRGFHSWNGGTRKKCTEYDFEAYCLQVSTYGRAFFRLRTSHVLLIVAIGVILLISILK